MTVLRRPTAEIVARFSRAKPSHPDAASVIPSEATVVRAKPLSSRAKRGIRSYIPLMAIRPPNYRLPEDTRVGPVRLAISDLDRSLSFYTNVLGLKVLTESSGAANLGAEGSSTALVELHEEQGVRPAPRRGLLGLFHFALLLPDRSALGRFLGHLGELSVPPGMSDHFVSEAVYLQDPDNLGIEVYRDRPRDEWREENGQLAMSTAPLDVEAVLASGGGQPWTGMPAGTRMGHVHLHVGDLDEGSRFYHDALGFDKVVWSYPGALFLAAGGYHHHLGTNNWARGAKAAGEEDARLLEWRLHLGTAEEVDVAAKSLARAGYVVEREGTDALVGDPWGTRLRLAP
jgi:catechol 2,3-dioxygenase